MTVETFKDYYYISKIIENYKREDPSSQNAIWGRAFNDYGLEKFHC